MLQVDKDHLRQGLGTLVAKALTKQLGNMGLDVCSCIEIENIQSIRLFQGIGFEEFSPIYFIRPKAIVSNKWVDVD